LRIFFRRFLITLPKGCSSMNRDGGGDWLVARRFQVNCAMREVRSEAQRDCATRHASQTAFADACVSILQGGSGSGAAI
jgi:hypothetical protein